MEPTTLDLLVAYVEVFLTLFAAAGNTVIGIVTAIIGVFAALFMDGTLG